MARGSAAGTPDAIGPTHENQRAQLRQVGEDLVVQLDEIRPLVRFRHDGRPHFGVPQLVLEFVRGE
jgi:hypothetical protein